MAAATSPERTVVFAHCASVSVVDATYLGFAFNATPMGWARISAMPPQVPANIVGPPAEQERVGALVDLVHKRRGFVVEQRQGPSVALESLPADLAVVSYGEVEAAKFVDPPLTMTALPAEDMGLRAARRMAARLRREPAHGSVVMKSRLVVRQSCGRH